MCCVRSVEIQIEIQDQGVPFWTNTHRQRETIYARDCASLFSCGPDRPRHLQCWNSQLWLFNIQERPKCTSFLPVREIKVSCNTEVVAVEVICSCFKFLVSSNYRPTNSELVWFDEFNSYLSDSYLIISGDFNLPQIHWDCQENRTDNLVRSALRGRSMHDPGNQAGPLSGINFSCVLYPAYRDEIWHWLICLLESLKNQLRNSFYACAFQHFSSR